MRRVAYVCADPGVPVFGRKGCSIHVQEVLRAMLRRGAEIDLFAARTGGEAPDEMSDIAVREIETFDGDVAQMNESLRLALADAGTFDLVYERYSLWSYAAMEHAAASGMEGLLEVNAPLIEEQVQHRGGIDRDLATRVATRVFNAASGVLAVSEEVASYLFRFTKDPLRVHVVQNGVDPRRFVSVRASHPAPAGNFTVGFVGNMRPWHGLPLLVDAFSILQSRDPNTRLLLVGGGQESESVRNQLAQRGLLDATLMTGPVDRDDVPGLLASMDVAVAPYPSQSNFYFSPLKVFEYMAAGVPTVASAVGQLNRLIEHERTGLLVPPGDARELARAIERVRDDATLRQRIGRTARAFVSLNHTWDHVVDRILQLAGTKRAVQSSVAERIGA